MSTLTSNHPTTYPSNDTIEAPDEAPTSFGTFKPTGHVMVGLPDAASRQALMADLRIGGWHDDNLQKFRPSETLAQMDELIANASPLAGFGSELNMMRRYRDETLRGTQWLLVKADDEAVLARLATVARRHGARLAVSYGTLLIEELL